MPSRTVAGVAIERRGGRVLRFDPSRRVELPARVAEPRARFVFTTLHLAYEREAGKLLGHSRDGDARPRSFPSPTPSAPTSNPRRRDRSTRSPTGTAGSRAHSGCVRCQPMSSDEARSEAAAALRDLVHVFCGARSRLRGAAHDRRSHFAHGAARRHGASRSNGAHARPSPREPPLRSRR